ncbi:MAG: bifunctional folylpolyglutamate synthase/dihydrofolate synthase [Candidatus Omnitrophica bacterium]|nr:bifunctional folylpolyglutamate synthase/dihydrofolate synthase [Candidatus Omnitrophota bacterium]MBU0878527.1 bifunctional folylpolyglutamate synthase/dihydrofolate synthase [Candidatus Omnitrophota bacterium]MBU0897186.1 bifunctional folylpolyglutamate synthase/dihydrofolate synthase [Candidatus Omnitrophota bacterium]MBU1133456.1 bifunctional folylpolyglutamate synthase/dihydrofolate synthase [Candidatus Omnitrophota bacterium]MBU1366847.1 bifunctional folylpolyglutamate synthase/dihydro
MTYKQALAYLYDLERFGIKPGLKRIKRLLELLGNPHYELKAIHIAGTNGKGSTAAFINSILKEAGCKAGLYISPHLINFRERITVNGSQIPEEKVVELLVKIRPQIKKIFADFEFGHPTFFEVVTAIAFSYFAQEKVDFAVLEAGLGGRLDATNVVEPLISVITNSDYDHMDKLGSEITSIAREHAGIIKKDSLVITAARGEALTVIKKVSQGQKTRLYQVGKDIRCESLESDWENQSFNIYPGRNSRASRSDDKISNRVKGIFSDFENLKIPLLGKHQLVNVCCAIGAVQLLKFHNILISDENIKRGLKKTRWPGRLEIVRRSPLIILDGAHNQPAARQLKQSLEEFLKKKAGLILVIGILKDKEIEKIVKELVPLAFKVVVTVPRTSRAALPEDICKVAVKYNQNVTVVREVEAAVRESLNEAKKDDIICVTGSLYTIGEARQFLMEEKKQCTTAVELKKD